MLSSKLSLYQCACMGWGQQFKQNGGFNSMLNKLKTCGAWRAYAA